MSEDNKNEEAEQSPLNQMDEEASEAEEDNSSDDDESESEEEEPEPEPITQEDEPQENPPKKRVAVRAGTESVSEEQFEDADEEDKKHIGIIYENEKDEIREKLENQEKVMINIPNDTDNENSYHNIQINGYRLQVKKGMMVEVPRQVAQLLADHFNINHNLGKDIGGQNFRLDEADEETKKALQG